MSDKSLEAQLYECLVNDNTKEALSIVEQMGDNVNSMYRCRSPLSWASKFENKDVVAALQDKGAKDEFDKNKIIKLEMQLDTALEIFSLEDVMRLVEEGANNLSGAMNKAVMYGDINAIDRLVELGAGKQKEWIYTGLESAVYSEKPEVVEHLIKLGVKLNEKNEFGDTPLRKAVGLGYYDILDKLIEAGADLDVVDVKGRTALMHAVENGSIDMVEKLVKAGANLDLKDEKGTTALMKAVEMQSLSKVRCLVKAGADVNLRGHIGRTALMDAAWRIDAYEVFNCLISAGADVNAKDLYGRNALMLASGRGNIMAVKDLIRLGADVNLRDSMGLTALMEGARNFTNEKSREVVAELVKSGADVNVQDNGGESALMYAYFDVVKMEELVKAGANVNLQNKEGKTVLMKVAGSFCGEHPTLTDLLLKENRKIFKKNRKTFKENKMALELLIENGADVNIKDNKGRNAIMYVKDDERKRRIIFDAIKKARRGEEASNNVGRIERMFR